MSSCNPTPPHCRCLSTPPPRDQRSFPQSTGRCLVASHDSWNRTNRTGYKVIRIRLKNGIPTREYDDCLTGFVVNAWSVWDRPVGTATAHDGALLVTKDGNGNIWRISPASH